MIEGLNKAPIVGFVRYSQKITFGIERDVFEPNISNTGLIFLKM
jgi:hypothetical protein